MNFIVVGTSHKHSPVEFRENLSLSKKKVFHVLSLLKQIKDIKSVVILSTCNRVEFYISADNSVEGKQSIIKFILEYYEFSLNEISSYLYIYENIEALRHLLSVTTGLDSLILGETQILGQVKSAFRKSREIGFTDNFMEEIFSSSIAFAKKIHTDTKISEGKVSIGSVGVEFIKSKIGELKNKNILIIGVGKVTELVLKYLKKEKLNVVFISNRTFKKASKLAEHIGAIAVPFDDLNLFLKKADIVITGTASPHYIIKKERIEKSFANNLLIVDLAVPRDVEPEVGKIKGIELFSLEQLDEVIEENLRKRQKEANRIKHFIDQEIEKLWKKFIESEPETVLLH